MNKPKIEYPCEWCYTIIGPDDEALREAARQALDCKAFTIAVSNRSKGGKYVSMIITTTVASEEERNALYKKLSDNPAVKIVM